MSDAAVSSRVRGALGLGSLAVGAVVLVGALAGPAGAHEGKEPYPIDETSNLSCAELHDKLGIDADWTVFKIEEGDLPDEGASKTYVISDRGTPDDDSDDATVTITMVMQAKSFDWTSTIGIDAIYVKGGSEGSYFYGYQPDIHQNGEITGPGEEAFSGIDHGTPPWHADKNQISHITLCYDEAWTPSTTEETDETTSTSETPSTAPPSTEAPTTSIDLNTDTTLPGTTTTTAIDLWASTAGPPTTAGVANYTLPKTGSNSTGLLIALGAVLVLGGGALLATTRLARQRGEG